MISFELGKEIEKFFFVFPRAREQKIEVSAWNRTLQFRILSSDALPLIHRYTSYDEEGGLLRSSYMTRVLQIFPFVPPPPRVVTRRRKYFSTNKSVPFERNVKLSKGVINLATYQNLSPH